MSKSEFRFSADGSQISDHKEEFKSPKISELGQKIVGKSAQKITRATIRHQTKR